MKYALICWCLYLILILMRAINEKDLPLIYVVYLMLSVWLGIELRNLANI